MRTSENSSDLERAAAARSIAVEFLEVRMAVQKLQRCEYQYFSRSRCTFWDPDSTSTTIASSRNAERASRHRDSPIRGLRTHMPGSVLARAAASCPCGANRSRSEVSGGRGEGVGPVTILCACEHVRQSLRERGVRIREGAALFQRFQTPMPL